ncbi:hypothetical protein R3P38DRAFT_3048630 [Favolaschia claudopus]|uniref:F-box domain-containing protein n=1 Tax=Favolaschia claudopus TaxID=2862362 RepID=A0AAW0A677_9AGAR
MHRALRIPEVVELICAATEFPALAALARTCQSFQLPALAVLWATQKQLTSLLKCLPSDALEEAQETVGATTNTVIRFRRPITSSDLSRLVLHAEKVKNLYIEKPHSVHWTVYVALSFALPALPLFPNLRHLTWKPPEEAYSHIRMFVGQKLRSVTLDPELPQLFGFHLLPYLRDFHPDLLCVEIGPIYFVQDPSWKEAMYSAIRGMNRLQDLKLPSLDGPTMLHLAQLPHLSHLEVSSFPQLPDDIQAQLAAAGPAFTSLHKFTTFSDSPASISNFLSMDAVADALTELILGFASDSYAKPEEWQTLSTIIARKSSQTLQGLAFTERFVYEDDAPDDPSRMIRQESFHPLLACPNLTAVILQIGYGITIDDDFIRKISEAWPRLQILNISPKFHCSQYVPRTTLPGLIPLAQHCRSLTSLTITLDATALDPHAKGKPGNGISSESLCELNVAESPISSPAAVASFLSAIFPKLERVVSRGDEERNEMIPNWEEYVERWDSVGGLVQVIAAARAQEHCIQTLGSAMDTE